MGELISHPEILPKLDLIPDISDRELFLVVFLLPMAVQWWSVWYPEQNLAEEDMLFKGCFQQRMKIMQFGLPYFLILCTTLLDHGYDFNCCIFNCIS